MTDPTPRTGDIDPLLSTLAERICTAAGTDLDTVLNDLLNDRADDRTPAGIRAGWEAQP